MFKNRTLQSFLAIFSLLLLALSAGAQGPKELVFQTDASSGDGLAPDITGLSLVGLTIVGSTGADRVVTFEVSDSIGTFTPISCTNVSSGLSATTAVAISTTPVRVDCFVGGRKKLRAKITGGTTGTITVRGLGLDRVSSRHGGGGGTSLGPEGTLQSSDGQGAFSAFSGTGKCDDGTFIDEVFSTGTKHCQPVIFPTNTAHLLSDRAESLVPNAINLALLPPGLLNSSPTGGAAVINTVPIPPGGLAGLSGPQTLLNTFVPFRVTSFESDVTPIQFNLLQTDVAYITELLQDTTMANPIGTSDSAQIVWLMMHSTIPRLLTWDTAWNTGMGLPLPTATTGGDTSDAFLFQYNPSTGKLDLLYSSQLARDGVPTGVIPGDYICPATQSVNAQGKITSITSGTCNGGGGGGGNTPAGIAGDIQLNGGGILAADSGSFSHDKASHTSYTQGSQTGTGAGYLEFTTPRGFKGWLFPADLTGDRAWKLPDFSGEPVLGSAVVVRADGFPGSDAGQKIAAAIASLPAGVGGYVDGSHFLNPQSVTGFTITPGVTVKLGLGLYTIIAGTGPIIVQQGGSLIGSGTNSPGATTVKMGNGGNSDTVRAISSGGTSNWWHHGEIRNLRIDGNKANNSTGHGLAVHGMGETSLIQRVIIQNAPEAGLYIHGSQAGTGSISNVTTNSSTTYGVQVDELRSALTLENVGGDSNPTTFGITASTTGIGGLLLIDPKAETTTGPIVRFVGGTTSVNLTVIGGNFLNAGASTAIQIDADVGANPNIQIMGLITGNAMTTLISDLKNTVTVTVPSTLNTTLFTYTGGGKQVRIDETGLAVRDSSAETFANVNSMRRRALVYDFGEPGGTALTAGSLLTRYYTIPFACTLKGWNILATSGTVTMKAWKKAAGTVLPTVSDSINTSGVSLSSGSVVQSTTMTDFISVAVAANDILAVNLSAVSSAAYVSVTLNCDQ